MKLNKVNWNKRYEEKKIGWDIGKISNPIKEYINQLKKKNYKILIPGCGNAYEADYLVQKKYTDITLLDFSEIALKNFKKRNPGFPQQKLLNINFFDLNGKYDLIIEQTFFCAIEKKYRKKYARKMHNLLEENGKLVGLLFNEKLNNDKPPFGGNKNEYLSYFEPFFEIKVFERAYNSIGARENRELFMILIKK